MSQQVNSSIKPSNDKFVLANKCENTGMSFPMHHHSEYEFYYVLEGEGRLFLDNTIYTVVPGLLCLFSPHNGHSVRIPANIPYRRITLNFSKFYLPKTPLLTNHAHFKPIVLSENDRLTFCRLCSEYTAASYQLNAPEDLKIALISDILSMFLPTTEICQNSSPVLSQIQVYVHHHTHAKLSCNEIADAMHYSARQLNRIFAETSGETLYQYIARAKVSRIQELLTQGFSPAYISEELGYSSPASLTRFFKSGVSLTPREWLGKYEQGS